MFITDNHVSQTNMGPLGGARSGGVQAVVLRSAHQRHYRGGGGGGKGLPMALGPRGFWARPMGPGAHGPRGPGAREDQD